MTKTTTIHIKQYRQIMNGVRDYDLDRTFCGRKATKSAIRADSPDIANTNVCHKCKHGRFRKMSGKALGRTARRF